MSCSVSSVFSQFDSDSDLALVECELFSLKCFFTFDSDSDLALVGCKFKFSLKCFFTI